MNDFDAQSHQTQSSHQSIQYINQQQKRMNANKENAYSDIMSGTSRTNQCTRRTSSNLSEASSSIPSYKKTSVIFNCLRKSVPDLVCQDHGDSEIVAFCCSKQCNSQKRYLCQYCIEEHNQEPQLLQLTPNLQMNQINSNEEQAQHNKIPLTKVIFDSTKQFSTNNEFNSQKYIEKSQQQGTSQHCIMNVHQFMDFPLLAFLEQQSDSSNDNRLLCEVISQSSSLFSKIKEQTDSSKNVLREYFKNLIKYITKESQLIEETFSRKIEEKLQSIRSLIDNIESVSNIYKDAFENILSSKSINSQNELVELSEMFLQTSEDPKDSVTTHYFQLQESLKSIPDLNIQGLKDLYTRMTDAFRLNYNHLINTKASPSNLKTTESIEKKLISIGQFQKVHQASIIKVVPLSESQTVQQNGNCETIVEDKFLTISSDNTIKIWAFNNSQNQVYDCDNDINSEMSNDLPSNRKFLIKSITRDKPISDCIALRDRKHVLVCSEDSHYLEMVNLVKGKTVFKDNSIRGTCLQEIPGYKFIVCDKDCNMHVFTYENVKKVVKLATFDNVCKNPVYCIDFTILPSNTFVPNQKNSGMQDTEILALAGAGKHFSLWQTNNFSQLKSWQHDSIKFGVNQLKFSKKVFDNKNSNGSNKAVENILLSLTRDGKLFIWNYIYSTVPLKVIDCQSKGIYTFGLLDEDKLLIGGSQNIKVASLNEGKILGQITEQESSNKQESYGIVNILYNKYIIQCKGDKESSISVYSIKF